MAAYMKLFLLVVLINCQLLIIHSGNIPQSLYDSLDFVVQLDNGTISKTIFNSGNCWIVEFYSSWCGHCIHFAPTYKQLALDLKAWKSVIGVASMDCAIQQNFNVCRSFKVEGYPTLKLFNASSSNNTGAKLRGGRQSDNIRHALVDHVEGHSDKTRPKHWPNLNPIRLSEVLEFKKSPTAKYLAVIFEDEQSYIGREVILDMVPYSEFKVARAIKNNTDLIKELQITQFPSLYVFYPDGRAQELRSTPDPTRESFRSLLLGLIGLSDNPELPKDKEKQEVVHKAETGGEDTTNKEEEKIQNYDGNTEANKDLGNFLGMEGMPGMERQQKDDQVVADKKIDVGVETKFAWDAVKKKKQEVEAERQELIRKSNTLPPVHMQDLESALTYALRQEVPLKETIEGTALVALRNFVAVLSKYFPGRSQISSFLESLDFWLMDQKRPSITSDEWLDFVNENYDPEKDSKAVLPHVVKWEGCLGSSPRYRGYPCSLWTLFHTLTVSAAKINKQNPTGNSQEVLQAMKGYIQEFFTCKECVKNFAKESKLMSSTVTSYDTAILYLWKIHNSVNLRLKGDMSEDPAHPKIQFPSTDLCQTCRLGKGHEDEWDKKAVLRFLKEYYSIRNIVFDRLIPQGKIPKFIEKDPPERFLDLGDIKLKQEVMKRELEKQLEVRLANDRLKYKSSNFYNVTNMDVSMCVLLYSVCIIICVFIYLAICRKKKRKTMKQKV
ncbi:sulfhydryl oxidase 2-like [Antedon mediterranea]|uniref:sulfhydryl oxidase 2-like n=1 Tax=Antedon mediterranea TaxID=105859 RepID=UPI003AF84C48